MSKVSILSSIHLAFDNRIFYREAQSLRKAGYDVTLIAVHDRNEVKDGIKIIGLDKLPRWRRPLLWLKLLRLALAERADLYHFHDMELLLVVSWLRLLTRAPTIYDIHEANADFLEIKVEIPTWIRYPLAGVIRRVEPFLSNMHSGLIFADDAIAADFARIRKPKTTIFNYPERSFIEKAAASTKRKTSHRPTVLHLGGHKRGRGIYLMLQAFQQVLEVIPEAQLLLVGPFSPASLEGDVRYELEHRGIIDSVELIGAVQFEKIGAFLHEADIGWVAWQPNAKNEKNIPTKLFEYMAYGLPVVASSLRSIRPYIRDGKTGYLAKASDPVAHAEAILNLLRDPITAAAMGKKGQELVMTRYNWDPMEQRLFAFYEKILNPAIINP